jgi:uncharacterized protein YecE (DUF72 family)
MIRIGTSGFSYEDWHGPFYPPSVRPQHRLEYYAQQFKTLELNSSFYTLPALPSIYGMLKKVPDDFDFFVKGHWDLTHGTRKKAEETLSKFRVMLEPYRAERKLAGVLLQFPSTFECSGKNENYLRWLLESFEKTRVVVEFRHARWITDQAMDFLRELNAGYCVVDMPQVRNLPSNRIEVTADFAYVRFHGQNRAMWEGRASRNERYDYDYSDEEIQGWVPVIADLSKGVKDTYVYYNNHYQGKAAKNAKTLQGLLDSFMRGSGIQRPPIG